MHLPHLVFLEKKNGLINGLNMLKMSLKDPVNIVNTNVCFAEVSLNIKETVLIFFLIWKE